MESFGVLLRYKNVVWLASQINVIWLGKAARDIASLYSA